MMDAKRKQWLAALSLLLVLMPFSHQTVSAAPEERTYTAEIHIEPNEHRVTGSIDVTFIPEDRNRAYFHLYPNAFRKGANVNDPNWNEFLGKSASPGEYSIKEVHVQGKRVQATVDDTVLNVPLGQATGNGSVRVRIIFELTLPHNNGRMSYDEHAMWLGNWLPILAVREQMGWRLDPYYPMGDPFYSESAGYSVKVTVPEAYQLATTGTESEAKVTSLAATKQKQYVITADNVRDFAIVIMDETYRVTQSKIGITTVKTWWQADDNPNQTKQLHEAAVESLAYFNKSFGTYPYAEYDVVRTGGFFGGMEYPCLVFIEASHFNVANESTIPTVVHETAHQWFYGLVGSDEVREAWLDESVTEYAALAFLQQYLPKVAEERVKRRYLRGTIATIYYRTEGILPWQAVDSFPNWQSYSDLVYSRGSIMFWELRSAWGEERLHAVLRQYVNKNLYGVTTGKELVAIFSQAAGADASPFYDYWMRLELDKEELARKWVHKGIDRYLPF